MDATNCFTFPDNAVNKNKPFEVMAASFKSVSALNSKSNIIHTNDILPIN